VFRKSVSVKIFLILIISRKGGRLKLVQPPFRPCISFKVAQVLHVPPCPINVIRINSRSLRPLSSFRRMESCLKGPTTYFFITNVCGPLHCRVSRGLICTAHPVAAYQGQPIHMDVFGLRENQVHVRVFTVFQRWRKLSFNLLQC
jgi:hypothetical protein